MGAVSLVRVVRSGLEESVHLGHVAVCGPDGRLVAFAGDPQTLVFARSCMKPLQAAVSLQAIGEPLPPSETALMCASHSGQGVHLRTLRRLLDRAGLGTDALRCPRAWPMDPAAAAMASGPRRDLHNCSGKHAGMLLACVRAGWDIESYPDPGHPLQRRIHSAVIETARVPEVATGVDGCGIPVQGMPLARLAGLFARMGNPDGLGELAPYLTAAAGAMLAEPYLVAGRDRVDTALMRGAGGIVAKGGAEGLFCAGVLGQGLGIAVKVADGSARAAGPALIRTLSLLGALGDSGTLEEHAHPSVLGGGRPVGRLSPDFDLAHR